MKKGYKHDQFFPEPCGALQAKRRLTEIDYFLEKSHESIKNMIQSPVKMPQKKKRI